MNIQRVSKVIEAYQSGAKKPAANAPKNSGIKDEVNISPQAKLYDFAKKALAAVPDVRQEKIDSIIKKMETGEYKVSSADIAEKMLG